MLCVKSMDAHDSVQQCCCEAHQRGYPKGQLVVLNRCRNTEGSMNGTSEGKVAIYRRHKFCLVMVRR